MKVIQGDLLQLAKDGEFDVIVHGANCFCRFGADIAAQIAKVFPEAERADLRTIKGDKSKLGHVGGAACGGLHILNAYTQYYPGKDFRVDAFKSAMELIRAKYPTGTRFGFPRIGCGIAGGDWMEVEDILLDVFGDDATIVVWKR